MFKTLLTGFLGCVLLFVSVSCTSVIAVGVEGEKPSADEVKAGRGGRSVLNLADDVREIKYDGFKFRNPCDPRLEVPVTRNSANIAEWQSSKVLPRDYTYYCTVIRSRLPVTLSGKLKTASDIKEYYDRGFKTDGGVTKYESRIVSFHGVEALEYEMSSEYAPEGMSMRMRGYFLHDPNDAEFTFEFVSCETFDSRVKRIPELEEITRLFFECFEFDKPRK